MSLIVPFMGTSALSPSRRVLMPPLSRRLQLRFTLPFPLSWIPRPAAPEQRGWTRRGIRGSAPCGPSAACRRLTCRSWRARTACRSAYSWSVRGSATRGCCAPRAGSWPRSHRRALRDERVRADGAARLAQRARAAYALCSQGERRSWEDGRGSAMADVERMYINGEWVHAEGGAAFDVINPADRSVIARVTNGAVPDVERAVTAAHAAFREWSVQAPQDRGRFLLRIQELMEVRRDDLARLVTLENGKPFEEAKKEVQFSLGYFGWFAEEARRMTGEWIPSPQPGKRYWVFRQPIGPVAAVTPWNFPATMVTRKIAPALAAGCTVVLKPAPGTPPAAPAIAQNARDAGLPPGGLNALTTNRSSL